MRSKDRAIENIHIAGGVVAEMEGRGKSPTEEAERTREVEGNSEKSGIRKKCRGAWVTQSISVYLQLLS